MAGRISRYLGCGQLLIRPTPGTDVRDLFAAGAGAAHLIRLEKHAFACALPHDAPLAARHGSMGPNHVRFRSASMRVVGGSTTGFRGGKWQTLAVAKQGAVKEKWRSSGQT
jgi:hypothetical protein